MKTPGPDPLDALLEQTLQSSSAQLDGDFFTAQVTARIEAQQHRMKSLRWLPALMGLITGLIVGWLMPFKASVPKDNLAILASIWDKLEPVLAWMLQPVPGTHLLTGWVVLAGAAALYSLWSAQRETATFRL